MRSRELAAVAILTGAALQGACTEPGACTLDVLPAIAVEVRDAVTDDFIGGIVRGVIRDGAFEDSLRVLGTLVNDPSVVTTLGGADERPGTYEVRLEGAGYEDWDTTAVRVTRDACHVETASFVARLQPTSGVRPPNEVSAEP